MTVRLTFGSVNVSMISTRYGVRSFLQAPVSADASADSRRFRSAHWETVRSAGGVNPFITVFADATVFLAMLVIVIVGSAPFHPFPDTLLEFLRVVFVVGQLVHDLVDFLPDHV